MFDYYKFFTIICFATQQDLSKNALNKNKNKKKLSWNIPNISCNGCSKRKAFFWINFSTLVSFYATRKAQNLSESIHFILWIGVWQFQIIKYGQEWLRMLLWKSDGSDIQTANPDSLWRWELQITQKKVYHNVMNKKNVRWIWTTNHAETRTQFLFTNWVLHPLIHW